MAEEPNRSHRNIRDVSGSPEPSLPINLVKKESFHTNFKDRESFLNPNCQLVPLERGLITEGSASHFTFRYSGTHM